MDQNLLKRGKILTWLGFCGNLLFVILADASIITGISASVRGIFTFLDLVSYGVAIWGMSLVLKAKKQSYFWLFSLLFYLFGIITILYFLEDKSAGESALPLVPPAPKKIKSDKTFGTIALGIAILIFILYYWSALNLYVSGSQTQGTVLPPDPNNELSHLSVQYSVSGKEYTTIDDTSFQPAGSTVIAHYDATDPSNAVFSAVNGNIFSYIAHTLETYYIFAILFVLSLLMSLKAFGIFGSKSTSPIPTPIPPVT